MSEPQPIGDYPTLLRFMRARVIELGITHETLDALAGFQSGYASKLLCDPPMKRLGPITMHIMFGALALRQVLEHDEEQFSHMRHRYEKRLMPRKHSVSVHKPIILKLTADFMQRIRIKGGLNSRKNMTPAKARRIARKAARARWSRPKVVELKGAKLVAAKRALEP